MKDTTITKALEAEKKFLSDKQARYIYDLREKSKRDLFSSIATAEERGEKRGERYGIEKERRNIVLNTLKKGMSVIDISNLTGIPLDFINKVKREQK